VIRLIGLFSCIFFERHVVSGCKDGNVLFFDLSDARSANIMTYIQIYICLWFYCALYAFLYDVLSITQMSI